MLRVPEARSSRWPKVINNENGRRNFNDALSHNRSPDLSPVSVERQSEQPDQNREDRRLPEVIG